MPRLFATLAALLISLPLAAHARGSRNQIDVNFRTFDEMMLMTPAHRLEYLIEMRKILIELEKNSESGLKVAVNEGSFHEWLNMFSIANANADSICNDDETFDQARGLCYRTGLKVPLDGYTCLKVPTQDGTGTQVVCVRKPEGGTISQKPGAGNAPLSVQPKDQSRFQPATPAAPATPQATSGDGAKGADGAPAITEKKPDDAATAKPAAPKPEDGPNEAPVEPGQKDWSVGCSPHPLVCQDREKFRAPFYALKAKCLYAGNISDYPESKPLKGKCSPVNKFSMNPDGAKPCPAGQVICNPLVFGMKSVDGKFAPICVAHGPEATDVCNTSAPPGNVDLLFKDNRFLGLKNEWDKFVGDLKKICDASDKEHMATAQFHCKECNIMHRRLFKLEERVQGMKLCSGGPATSKSDTQKAAPNNAPVAPPSTTIK
jgi:hypothetical protein